MFSTRRDLTHNMKSYEPRCPMLGFNGVKVPFFFSKLLNMLNVNSCLFLNSDLENSNFLPVQNSVICLILFIAPHPLPSGTLKSITEHFIFQGKELDRK